MPLEDTFLHQQVNDAIADLTAIIDDAKRRANLRDLEQHLPRLAYVLTHNQVLIQMLNELPKADIQSIVDTTAQMRVSLAYRELPIEPKARLSKQIAILVAIGEQKLSLWSFCQAVAGDVRVDFWQDFFFPATRDLLRYAISLQKDFHARKKLNNETPIRKMSAPKNYALDLFISHSSKDKAMASALIEFLRAALAIPHARVRCTSVDGYKLSAGAKTEDALRREIQGARCFIGLITPESMRSQFVLFELGARWGSEEHFVPLLAGGMRTGVLRPPLSSLNALDCASKDEMEQLVHDLGDALNKKPSLSTLFRAQLSALLTLNKQPGAHSPPTPRLSRGANQKFKSRLRRRAATERSRLRRQ